MVDTDEFSLKRLEKYIWLCADNETAIPTNAFCGMLDEIVRLLAGLGKAMYIAFKDVKDKSEDMRKNRNFLVSEFNKPKNMTL